MFTHVFKLNTKGKTSVKKRQFIGIRGEKLGLDIEVVEIAFNFNYDQDNHESKEEVITEGKNRTI